MNSEQLLLKLAGICDCVQECGSVDATFAVNCPTCGPQLVKTAFLAQYIEGTEGADHDNASF